MNDTLTNFNEWLEQRHPELLSTEDDLARKDPDLWDLNVNGIRRIHVKDTETHLIWDVIPNVGMILKYDKELV